MWQGTLVAGVDSYNSVAGFERLRATSAGAWFLMWAPDILSGPAPEQHGDIDHRVALSVTSDVEGTTNSVYTIGGDAAGVSNYTGVITTGTGSATAEALKLTAASGGRVNFNANIVRAGGATGTVDHILKIGTGVVSMGGSGNNWKGNTLVQEGTFLVNGTIVGRRHGHVQVSSGARLGGAGTITRQVTIANGAILSAGDYDTTGATRLGGKLTLKTPASLASACS